MISETPSIHTEQSTLIEATNVVKVDDQEGELNTISEVNNLQQIDLEQINHVNDTSSKKQSDEIKSQPINVTSIQQEETTTVSKNMIQPILLSNAGPVDLLKSLVSSTPRKIFVLYLLILFTWSYLQRSPLILLSLGVAFGYLLRANTVTNEVKEKIVSYIFFR